MTMKTSFLGGIAAILVSVSSAFGQMPAMPPTISVSGSAEVKVAPDEVYLRVGVETRDATLARAKERNDEAVTKTLAFLRAQVEKKNVQTDFISFEPIYDGSSSDRIKPIAYVARNSIEVKLTDLKKLDGVITGVMTNGVNTIHGIEFRTSELRKHRDAARAMAIRAAIEKADAAAKELNVKRGKVQNLSVNDGWWGGYGGGYWGGRYAGFSNAMAQNVSQGGGGGQDESGTLSAGQITVSASVSGSFLVE
jgi:uncharacterized protein